MRTCLLFGLLLCVQLIGCASSSRDRAWLDRELQARTGAGLRGDAASELPDSVQLEDGLDETESTALALWHHPALRAELARSDAARAVLREANRPANPQLSIMGNLGPITAVATLLAPLESLWQLPSRAKAAARTADAVAEEVLMRALDGVYNARLLHVELGLASDRLQVRRELAQIAMQSAHIAAVRARAGEISQLEERMLAADAQSSEDALELAETEHEMARAPAGSAGAVLSS